ncbi:hypothetical protein JCM11641_000329 [Rhodosporidiobolus odoratus]
MSPRPTTPPSDSNYLRNLPTSSFMVAPPASTADQHTQAPTYQSGPATHPSDIYARPAAPSDIASENFQWGDDAASTIAPDDSVSQIDRRFTGRRRLMGARPMDALPEVPSVPEEYALEETVHRDYVPPELLEDDKSTVVPPAGTQSAAMRAVNPSSAAGPLARARGEGNATAIPYASPRQYAHEEDEDVDDKLAQRPLVPGAPGSGAVPYQSRNANAASGVAPYSRPTGYAAVGKDDDEDEDGMEYAAYSRAHADLEAKAGSAGTREASTGTQQSATTLVGALGNPLGYFKSMRRASSGVDKGFYTPQELAFQPPSSSSVDRDRSSYPPSGGSLQKLPSLDVAGPADRSYGGGQDGSQIQPKPLWQRWFWDTTPDARKVWEHKRGMGMQRWPFASWTLAVVMTCVCIYELVKMKSITGSPIQTKPSFNVMIGPSGAVLINLGARFAGCMKFVDNVTDIAWTCLKDTNKATLSSADPTCTMSDICGFSGFDIVDGDNGPNQSFRFFTPMFLHAGVVHLVLNMLAQCFSSALVERMMGTPRFLVLYLASGIFGFILSANFALVGIPSVGASGAIFGTNAALLVDLLTHWSIEYRPVRKLLLLIVELVIGFGLGWVPGLDNFAHIGGFAAGLLSAVVLLPVVHPSSRHKWITLGCRVLALPLLVVIFAVLTRNFYTSDPNEACSWCRYLSCWPTSSNNHCKGTGLSTTTASSLHLPELFTVLISTFVLPLL